MLITDRNIIELIALGLCLRWIAQKADFVNESEKDVSADERNNPQVRKVEIIWWDDPEQDVKFCKVRVYGQIGMCAIKVTCPLEWEGEGESGNLDVAPGDRVPNFRNGA